MNIIIALLILSVIIIIHEFGHFILAKANGIGVTEFAVGMGPRIIKVQIGETLYCVKLLPFGGSCMMVGEDENSSDAKAFNNKSVWARISVIAAGPIFNFILAFIMAIIIISYMGYDPCVIYDVEEGSVAYMAGLRSGDEIQSINKKKVVFSREFTLLETVSPDEQMEIMYVRNNKEYTVTVVPKYVEEDYYQVGISISGLNISSVVSDYPAEEAGVKAGDKIVSVNGVEVADANEAVELIGQSGGESITMEVLRGDESITLNITPRLVHVTGYETGITIGAPREKTGAINTVVLSFYEVKYWIKTVFESLKMLVTGQVTTDDMAGPVGVVSLIGDVVNESKSEGMFIVLINIFNLTLMLSANLGVMNLLPLPALDGGRLLFLIIEAVRKKPVSREKEGMVHFVGLVLLMLLMVFITFNDIMKLF